MNHTYFRSYNWYRSSWCYFLDFCGSYIIVLSCFYTIFCSWKFFFPTFGQTVQIRFITVYTLFMWSFWISHIKQFCTTHTLWLFCTIPWRNKWSKTHRKLENNRRKIIISCIRGSRYVLFSICTVFENTSGFREHNTLFCQKRVLDKLVLDKSCWISKTVVLDKIYSR